MKDLTLNLLNVLRRFGQRDLLMDFRENTTFSFDEMLEGMGTSTNMNLFPSDSKGSCYEIAMFFSCHKPIFGTKLKRSQMVGLDEVLKKLVQQVLGTCYPKNKKIILCTDKIDTEVFDAWIGNLRVIKSMGFQIEIVYLRSDGSEEFINSLIGI